MNTDVHVQVGPPGATLFLEGRGGDVLTLIVLTWRDGLKSPLTSHFTRLYPVKGKIARDDLKC